ncbi:MAG: hypothetical protein ACI3VS_05665, partial [Evtepia sp.]
WVMGCPPWWFFLIVTDFSSGGKGSAKTSPLKGRRGLVPAASALPTILCTPQRKNFPSTPFPTILFQKMVK